MRWPLALCLSIVSSPALADEHGRWDYGLAAGADASRASTAEDNGNLGGEVHLGYQLDGGDCKTLELKQGARYYWYDAQRGAGFSGSTEVCIDQVERPDAGMLATTADLISFPRIVAGYDLTTAARPRLDAPPAFAVDDYSLYGTYFGFGFYESRDERQRISAARFHVRGDVTLQGTEAELQNPSQGLFTAAFTGFMLERERQTDAPAVIEAARVTFRFEGNQGTSLLDVTPLSIERWRRGDWRLSANAGYTYGHAAGRRMHLLVGGAGVETVARGVTLGLRYQRGVLPAVDPIVIVDDRATAHASYPWLGGTLLASGFVASTLAVSTTEAMLDTRDVTGGASLGFSRRFTPYLVWHATVEVGRSFYARLDPVESSASPEVGTVARASTGFQARFGR